MTNTLSAARCTGRVTSLSAEISLEGVHHDRCSISTVRPHVGRQCRCHARCGALSAQLNSWQVYSDNAHTPASAHNYLNLNSASSPPSFILGPCFTFFHTPNNAFSNELLIFCILVIQFWLNIFEQRALVVIIFLQML